ALHVIRANPFSFLAQLPKLFRGRAALKQGLARSAGFDPAVLPYNAELLEWLRAEKAAGRTLILCTASDAAVAEKIAEHLGIFDQVLASDGRLNLKGTAKADSLRTHFGENGFDYAGNSSADLPVWKVARGAVIVGADTSLIR